MNKLPMLPLLLLMSMALLQATASGQSSNDSQASTGKAGPATIRGCLQRSEGHYILVDQTNTAERLSDSRKLKLLVDHEVEITGQPRIRTLDTTQPGTASSVREQPYFEVKTVKDVAATCQSIVR